VRDLVGARIDLRIGEAQSAVDKEDTLAETGSLLLEAIGDGV